MLLLSLLAPSCVVPDADAKPAPIEPVSCFRDVATTLSADDMDGRGIGTAGLAKAADYLAGEMKALGLKPGVKGYKLPFTATTGVKLGATNTLDDGAARTLDTDWVPAGFSRSGTVDADVVFEIGRAHV